MLHAALPVLSSGAINESHVVEWTSCPVKADAVNELYAECLALNIAHPNGPQEMKPWGTREFAILDPSGVRITFAGAM